MSDTRFLGALYSDGKKIKHEQCLLTCSVAMQLLQIDVFAIFI